VQFITPETGTYNLDVFAGPAFGIDTGSETAGHYTVIPLTATEPQGLAIFFPAGYIPWTALPQVSDRPEINPIGEKSLQIITDRTVAPDEILFQSHEFGLTAVVINTLDTSFINQSLIFAEDG